MASAGIDQTPLSLISLPPELLHQIFIRCEPADLAALRRAHRALRGHLGNAPHLWKHVYHRYWDAYTHGLDDALLVCTTPSTRSITRATDWQGRQAELASTTEKGKDKERNGEFDYAQQVQRRTWAEKQIQRLRRRPIEMYANYNDVLHALLSVARSRQPRSHASTSTDEHVLTQEAHETADYLVNLLTGSTSMHNFRQLIYPRSDVKQLRDWQIKQVNEQCGRKTSQFQAQRQKDEKRARSSSAASSPAKAAKRSRLSSGGSDATITAEQPTGPRSARLASPYRRRSARVQLHAYPTELHHLLYDKRTNNLITLDDGTGVANLEELDLLDEQAAAELHVLHGIHPGFREKVAGAANPMSRAARQLQQALDESEDEEEEDSDFIDAGTPSDPPLTDADDDDEDGAVESEEEELDDNVFRFFVDQLDLRRHYREPALGTDLGHEGSIRLRGRAREIVYDTVRYGPENSYGPLRAWRERYTPLDGDSFQAVDASDDGEEEGSDDGLMIVETGSEGSGGSGEDEVSGSGGEEDSDSDHPSPGERSDGEVVEEADDDAFESLAAINTPFVPGIEDEEGDEDFDEEEEEEDDDGESTLSNLLWELREMAIARSRGLAPYYEARKMMVDCDWQVKPGAVEDMESESHGEREGRVPLRPRPCDIWRTDKRVDWTVVEAIMVVMYCNIRHAVLSHGWGLSFRLPRASRSLNGHDQYAREVHADHQSTQAGAWRDMVGLPCGWSHSRGTLDRRGAVPPADASSPSTSQPDRSIDAKPYDWAGVESTWIGTYAFLDWSKWASFNARDPISRGFAEGWEELLKEKAGLAQAPVPTVNVANTPSLENEREALGDCLQLRMELLPLSQQRPRTENERMLSYLEGNDMECIDLATAEDVVDSKSTCQMGQAKGQFPPLRFRGHTRTYLDDGPPVPRGELYGTVRPVFAEKGNGKAPRAIVAIHWDITHRYDGEDAWSLSGVQAGPPGTRAPIYGIWGAAARHDNLSPCGPFTYYKTSERPWKEVDVELQAERQGRPHEQRV